MWLVTGVSSGLGRAIAEAALGAGLRVAGTVRNPVDLAAFEALAPGRAIGVRLDIADHAAAPAAVAWVEAEVGPIGVLVNNAGYGHEGPIEAIGIADFKRLYDTNLFGTLAVTQAVLPFMRGRRAGRIINVSSSTSVGGPAGLAAYASSKAAMNCLSEALAKEVAPFGVRVINLLPGSFRSRWAGASLRREGYEAYPHLAAQSEARRQRDGAQTGDPVKFAAVVLQVAEDEDPPLHLILGPTALVAYRNRGRQMIDDADRSEAMDLDTQYG